MESQRRSGGGNTYLSRRGLDGHNKRFIAQKKYRKHIVRAVYEYESTMPVLVTVYFPYSKEYFQGGGKYESAEQAY